MIMKNSHKTRAGFHLKPICAAVLMALAAQTTQANPLNPQVVSGQASIVSQGNVMTVTNAPGTIINWNSFSIGANETTRFAQQSAASTVLNRVTGVDPSSILGTLQSNGRVFLINPNGVIFGAGATVDVAGFGASPVTASTSAARRSDGPRDTSHSQHVAAPSSSMKT
ncbi:MAG: filamentous hemagglutinin N-terminal domain-containing protein, partial [Burkholderiales bacterium]|nr:filamentous hemagglutinin N-terminal domain-containing protein [Burkholderiales bacterium]